MAKAILIFAYYSYNDPVFQSAVLPYFENFPDKEKFKFILLTFEQKKYNASRQERTFIKNKLSTNNIIWHNSVWHSGKFKRFKKIFDFTWGILFSTYLIVRYNVSIVYSEGFPGAIIGHYISKLTFTKHIVHTFEPHADYMIEAGVWASDSWEATLLKKMEKRTAANCSYIFTATVQMLNRIKEWGTKAQLYRAPSCVDISLFNFSATERRLIRGKYNVSETDCVLVYLGKLGGYYWEEELFQLFSYCEQHKEQNFKYFILSPEAHEKIYSYFENFNIPKEKCLVAFIKRSDVFKYLSASDIGISAVRPYPSKRFCSPIKNGEYWACGLPIVIPKGVSDDYLFASENNIGIIVNDLSDTELKKTAGDIVRLYKSNNAVEIRQRCIDFVKHDRNIINYQLEIQKCLID